MGRLNVTCSTAASAASVLPTSGTPATPGRSVGFPPASGVAGRRFRLGASLALLLASTTACEVPRFGFPTAVTVQAHRMLQLWEYSTIAALVVGVFVWSFIFWAIIAYRKKSEELPEQVHQHIPIEITFTIVPFVIVAVLFYFTARDEIFVMKKTKHPDVTVGVVGFRWNWQFNHEDPTGATIAQVTGRPGEPAELVLPVHRTVRFVETSPDVIHSFWIPQFLFKLDVVPGRVNQFEVTINQEGTYVGRCAELCGTDHDRMNFTVRVVSPEAYTQWLATHQFKGGTTVATTAAGSVQ